MTNQEIIRTTIPANNKWHSEELEARAEMLGMSKSGFQLLAIDTFMNFDDEFIKTMIDRTTNLKIPLYVAIQNTIIAEFARDKARQSVYGGMVAKREEFPMLSDESGWHMLTGKALEEYLTELYIKEFEQEKKDINQ